MTRMIVDDIGDTDVIYWIEEALVQYIDYRRNGGDEEDRLDAHKAEEAYNLIHYGARYEEH